MSSPFIKQLAASDRKTRDEAFEALAKFLSANKSFEELELMKLWKGLYYCFWHSDRIPVQQALAKDFSELCLSITITNFIPFLKAFWKTIIREWSTIDILRLDKYYSLLRFFVHASFERLRREKWIMTESYIEVLEQLPLSVHEVKVPDGIRYHLCDIYIDELIKVIGDDREVPVDILLRPFENIVLHSRTKAVRIRAMKRVFEHPEFESFGFALPDVEVHDVNEAVDDEISEDEKDGAFEDESTGSELEEGEDAEFAGFD